MSIFVLAAIVLLVSCKDTDVHNDYAKIFKYDGSIQCESDGISREGMLFELTQAGIDVLCSQKGNDGLGRIAMCGADTGNINIFTINSASYQDAEKIGFQLTSELPKYKDKDCDI